MGRFVPAEQVQGLSGVASGTGLAGQQLPPPVSQVLPDAQGAGTTPSQSGSPVSGSLTSSGRTALGAAATLTGLGLPGLGIPGLGLAASGAKTLGQPNIAALLGMVTTNPFAAMLAMNQLAGPDRGQTLNLGMPGSTSLGSLGMNAGELSNAIAGMNSSFNPTTAFGLANVAPADLMSMTLGDISKGAGGTPSMGVSDAISSFGLSPDAAPPSMAMTLGNLAALGFNINNVYTGQNLGPPAVAPGIWGGQKGKGGEPDAPPDAPPDIGLSPDVGIGGNIGGPAAAPSDIGLSADVGIGGNIGGPADADPGDGDGGGSGAGTGDGGGSGAPGDGAYGLGGVVRDRLPLPGGLEPIRAHQGEYVMTRKATRRFLPVLEMMNMLGGGRRR